MTTYLSLMSVLRTRYARGFSMIELMVVLGIVCILLTIGVPSFSSVIKNQKLATAVNDFFMAINLARAEAIRRATRVDLAPADGVDWAKGWVVFVDSNNNQIADAGEQVIFSHESVSHKMMIKSDFTDSAKPYLAYNAAGHTRTNASSQAPQFGTISFALDDQVRRIKLNFLGRPRSCNPANDKTCTGSADAK